MIDTLTRNAVDVLPAGGLEEKLKLGRPLRVKLGIDVTSPDIHVGRGIPLQRMRAFQDAGHVGVFIVGDYTTRIGDPSGRSSERPILSPEEIDRNAKSYMEQAFQIIDADKTEVRFNSEWLAGLDFADVIALTRTTTVAQILERDDFSKRMAAREPISVSELLYPLMQAYDSVAIEADVELGGTDQLYNLLAGRMVMEAYGLEPQVVLTTPLLLSWDGEKMSSSVGNNIPLTAPAEEQFGRTMRIPDSQLDEWYRLVLERACRTGSRWTRSSRSRGRSPPVRTARRPPQPPRSTSPASCARGRRRTIFRTPSLPPGDPVHLPALLAAAFGLSTSEARRLIAQGGVKLDGEVATELDVAARHARRHDRASGKAAVRAPARNCLTGRRDFATVPRPPERVGVAKSPSSTQPERLQASIGYDQHRKLWRPLARVGGFFTPPPVSVALVFENSTACVYVETSWSRGPRSASRARL